MTATATAVIGAPAPHLGVQQIGLNDLLPSPSNPRRCVGDVLELAESIRQSGIQVPLTVRPAKSDGYEIVAGHRRYFAAEQLGLPSVPCIVRELTDDEAREIALVDNLQREDLDALDEAEAYSGLIGSLGTVSAVAARTGKPIEHVTRVLKLRTLAPHTRSALGHRLIAVDHALLLCKLAEAEQERGLRWVLQPSATRKEKTEDIIARCVKDQAEGKRWSGSYWQPQSVVSLKAFIEREIKLELKRAPWDLADAELLPSAGACADCAKNTAANAALFGDLAIAEAVCTDAACFNAKREAFVQVQLAAVANAGKGAVRISWKQTNSKPRAADEAGTPKFLTQLFKAGQWVEAKNGSCEHVRTGVTVDFEESVYGSVDAKKKPGMKLLVCVHPECKAHPKAWAICAARPSVVHNPAALKAEREKRAEAIKAENAIRAQLVKQAIQKVKKLDGELLRRVVLLAAPEWMGPDEKAMFPGLLIGLKTLKVDSPGFARAVASLLFVADGGDFLLGEWDTPEQGRAEFIGTLKLLGVADAEKAWAKPAETKKVAAAPKRAAKKAAKKGGRR